MAIAFKALAVIGIAAKAFPVELDTGEFFIVECGDIEAEFAVAGKVNRIGHGQRRLLAEEAVQNFFGFRMVLELGFHMGARTETAGEWAVCHMIDDRNRLLQDGFQIVRQVFLRILKQGRFEADDGCLG